MNERRSVEGEDVATPAGSVPRRRYLPAIAIALGAAAITASLFALYRDEADHHRPGSEGEQHSDGHQHDGANETATSQAEADHQEGPEGSTAEGTEGSGGSGESDGARESDGAGPSGQGEAPVEAAPGDPLLEGAPPASASDASSSTTFVPVVSTWPSSTPAPASPTTSTTAPRAAWSGAGLVSELFDELGLG